jgi:hypothetical protein
MGGIWADGRSKNSANHRVTITLAFSARTSRVSPYTFVPDSSKAQLSMVQAA